MTRIIFKKCEIETNIISFEELKILSKTQKKELLSIHLNCNQKLQLEIIFFMYQYICLVIVTKLEPSLHSLAISKWHNWQLDKNYIYIYFIVISKKIFFFIAKNVLSSLFLLFISSKNYDFSIILFQKLTISLKFIRITTPYMFWQKVKSKSWS